MHADPLPITRITSLECEVLEAARALEPREADGDAIHLHIQHGTRRWLVDTDHGQLWAAVTDDHLDPALDLHLPLSDRVTRFLETLHHQQPTLAVAADATAVVRAQHIRADIDLVPWNQPPPRPIEVCTRASVTLPLWRFAQTLTSARVMPSGADPQRSPWPPMWLTIDQHGLSLHIDWTDFLPGRVTYTMAATEVSGSGTLALPHRRVDDFFRSLGLEHVDADEDDPVMLKVGIGDVEGATERTTAVVFECDPWTLLLMTHDVVDERWGDAVERQLEPFVVRHRDGAEWLLDVQGRPVRVRLTHGHPDTARVCTELATDVHESIELLREVSLLNATSHDVRYWFQHDTVWAAVDLPCTRLDDLPGAVRALGQAAAHYEPLLRVWS